MARRYSTGLVQRMGGVTTNLLTNGTFDTNTTGWTGSGATLASAASGYSGNGLTITSTGAARGTAYVDVTTRIGRVYRVEAWFKAGTADGLVLVGTTADPDAVYTSQVFSDADWTKKEFAFMASATTTRLSLSCEATGAGQTARWDSVIVDEIWPARLSNFMINWYTGSQPATADDAATGTLLITFSKNGDGVTGLEWGETSTAGVTTKPAGDSWQGTGLIDGSAGWARYYEVGDNPAIASTTAARIDVAIGTSAASAETVIPNVFVQAGAVCSYTSAQIGITK